MVIIRGPFCTIWALSGHLIPRRCFGIKWPRAQMNELSSKHKLFIQWHVFGDNYVHLRTNLWELITTRWFENRAEGEIFISPGRDQLSQVGSQINIIADEIHAITIITIIHSAHVDLILWNYSILCGVPYQFFFCLLIARREGDWLVYQ